MLNYFSKLYKIQLRMKDEQKQAFLPFKLELKQAYFTMRRTEDENIEINVENKQTFDRYYRLINQDFMREKAEFSKFTSPLDLYEAIADHSKSLVVEEGKIQFQYEWGFKKKVALNTSFTLEKLESDQLQKAQLRIQRLTKEVERLQAVQAQLHQSKEKYRNCLLPFINSIGPLFYNSHTEHFKFIPIWNNSAKVAHEADNASCYNFVNNAQILPHQKATYKVKIYQESKVYLGFCTNSGISRVNNFAYTESSYIRQGLVYQEGKSRYIEKGVYAGAVVDCCADLLNGKFIWMIDGKIIAESPVPECLRRKTVYLSILMSGRAEVDLLI